MSILHALVNLLVIGAVAFRWWRSEKRNPVRRLFWPALSIKLLAGIALGIIYSTYYRVGDTWNYFEYAQTLTEIARESPVSFLRILTLPQGATAVSHLTELPPRALMMVKIVALVNLITHDNYWISSLYFSFLSFAGSWFLVRTLVQYNDRLLAAAVIGFLFFPSVVIWSAGMLKESLAMAALCYLSAIALKVWWRNPVSWWQWGLCVFGLWGLWEIKYYYLAVFLPLVLAGLAVERLLNDRAQPKALLHLTLVWIAMLAIPLALISFSRPNFYPARFLGVVTANNAEVIANSEADNIIHYRELAPTIGSFVRNAPWALFSGLFRKLPWETNKFMQVVSGIENLLLLLLTISALRNLSKLPAAHDRLLIFTALFYCLVLCTFLALSTPNFGTLSRYRIGFLPFFVLLISIDNPVLRWLFPEKQ
jgi:hypothetical protein